MSADYLNRVVLSTLLRSGRYLFLLKTLFAATFFTSRYGRKMPTLSVF